MAVAIVAFFFGFVTAKKATIVAIVVFFFGFVVAKKAMVAFLFFSIIT
jgi:hypothetical protein